MVFLLCSNLNTLGILKLDITMRAHCCRYPMHVRKLWQTLQVKKMIIVSGLWTLQEILANFSLPEPETLLAFLKDKFGLKIMYFWNDPTLMQFLQEI